MGLTIYNDPSAGVNPAPLGSPNGVPQARPDKVDIDVLVAGYGGTAVFSGCAVTPHSSGASLNVDVALGSVNIAGVTTAVAAQANLTIATADATNPRRDLVSINSSGTAVVTTGTAAATPDLPNVPATSVAIAVVDVPATATSITASNITDKRVVQSASSVLSWTAVKTANYTAVAGDGVPCDTTGGTFTVTLPNTPADKTLVGVKIVAGTTALTVACAGSDVFNVAAGGTSATLTMLGAAYYLEYKATGAIWFVVAKDVGPKITVAASAPASPATNDIWINTT